MLRPLGITGLVLATFYVGFAGLGCGSSGGNSSGPEDAGNSDGTSSGSGGSSGGGSGGSSGGGSGGSSGGSSGSGSGGSSGSSGGGGDSGADSGTAFDPSVYQHHRNGSRDGLYIDPVFTKAAAATTHTTTFMGGVSSDVYAQPLYVENGPGGDETFIVATENNHVTAYSATTGASTWDDGPTIIGTPFGSATGTAHAPGGQVDSSYIGVTGTPYIDIASRTVFFDAMTTSSAAATLHKVYAVSLDTGHVLPNWPVAVDTVVKGFDSGVQNQRGALQFLNGVLYVPYGGYNGDGGSYYGSVIGFPVATPQTPTWWHTTAPKCGIWGPGSLPTDGTSLFPVTGNAPTNYNGAWGGNEAVLRLAAGPTFSGNTADYFAPGNWLDLDHGDTDLGGASEVLVDMQGAKYPHLVVVGGKDANMYVLNRDSLGGIGGQLLTMQVGNSQVKGAPAAYTTSKGTYVAFHIEGASGHTCPSGQDGNLVVMKLSQSATAVTATTAWCSTSAQGNVASPMVTTTDGTSNPIVWGATGSDGSTTSNLYGWDGDTGALIVDGTKTAMTGAFQKWNTPINAKGRIVVGVNGQLYVFTP